MAILLNLVKSRFTNFADVKKLERYVCNEFVSAIMSSNQDFRIAKS